MCYFCYEQECSFCEDARFARTGVCISCDAGMCRSYFHVTCAQREGLLSEAAAEEVGRPCWQLNETSIISERSSLREMKSP